MQNSWLSKGTADLGHRTSLHRAYLGLHLSKQLPESSDGSKDDQLFPGACCARCCIGGSETTLTRIPQSCWSTEPSLTVGPIPLQIPWDARCYLLKSGYTACS